MLFDTHCHIDAYPQPAQVLAAGETANVHTVAVTTSLVSYARTRIVCRRHAAVQIALGLHPRRAGAGYDQWSEWLGMLPTVPLIGEVGLDFRIGKEEHWAAQARVLEQIATACEGNDRLLIVHSHYAEAEVWDILSARKLRAVIWHDYRAEGPKSILYRAIAAGHYVAIGPDTIYNGSARSRLRALPREQILTETNGPWSRVGTGDRAAALREVLAVLADAWQCVPEEAEAQVEQNYTQLMAAIGQGTSMMVDHAARAV